MLLVVSFCMLFVCSAFDCVVLCDFDVRIVFAMFFLLVLVVFVSWLLLADVCVSACLCLCSVGLLQPG